MTATVTNARGPVDATPLLDRLADRTIQPTGLWYRGTFALGSFALSTALRVLLDPYLPPGFPFLTYFPAVAVTAVMAGSLAGVATAVLSFFAAWFLFIPPAFSFWLAPGQWLALILYAVVVATELGLVFVMRRALRRLAQAETVARDEARTRTLMFHELQHRVSNNLAVVGSLLQLQRREVKDPQAIHALDAAVTRVNVVSRLNRLLHNPSAQEVDFGAFLRAMVPDAVAAAGVVDRVQVTVRAEPVVVPAEKAVPLGLVATELLANALEHGFPSGRSGRVDVTLVVEDGTARLAIRDDGAGLPDGFDLERTRSLGLQIARQFAGQLGASLRILADEGVVSRLDVPLG